MTVWHPTTELSRVVEDKADLELYSKTVCKNFAEWITIKFVEIKGKYITDNFAFNNCWQILKMSICLEILMVKYFQKFLPFKITGKCK